MQKLSWTFCVHMFFAYVVFFKVRLDTHASSLLLKYIPGYIRKLHKILTAGNEFGPAVNWTALNL